SRNGLELVSGGKDGIVHLWDVRSHRLVREYRGHDGAVLAVAAPWGGSPPIVSYGRDGALRTWSRDSSPEAISHFKDRVGAINSLAFSSSGGILAVGGDTLKLIDEYGNDVDLDKVPAPARNRASSPDGNILAVSTVSGEVKIWNVRNRSVVQRLREPSARLQLPAFSPDGKS